MIRSYCYKSSNHLHPPKIMTIDEYNELLLQDELKIGYGIPEDEDLPTQYDELREIEEDCYIDGLLTDGRIDVDASEMFGDEVVGYSLY